MGMFCYQCQETVGNKGCTVKGVCGKEEGVAKLQDLLIYLLKGISFWANKAKKYGVRDEEVDLFVAEGLFSTITNVNFDKDRMVELIEKAFELRDKIKEKVLSYDEESKETIPDAATWRGRDIDEFLQKGEEVGFLSEPDEDIRSLKSLILFGLKGVAAYLDHAYILKHTSEDIFDFIERALVEILRDDISADELTALVLECGKFAVSAMALLDEANTKTYGHPEPTQVYTGLVEGPAILVSGHDLLDLEEILKQTEGKGINVYTHGEMLPANAYPGLKKYKHLKGNYGTSWYNQQKEFDEFGGAIVMTTNCIQKPRPSYKDRIFTTGLVAWPTVAHIPNRVDGKPKDFSPVIKKALEAGSLRPKDGKTITIGFAHNTLINNTDKILSLVKQGKIRQFFVMSGCDGRFKERQYYTEFAQKLPKDTVILTSGCAKYRYNMLELGTIDGMPRVLDAGQCNDSYSVALLALHLKEVLGLDDINKLPISYNIAWYEQKAVCVLLGLLYLGVKKIRLGPTLPAFISPGVLDVLVKKFDIRTISSVEKDMEEMMASVR